MNVVTLDSNTGSDPAEFNKFNNYDISHNPSNEWTGDTGYYTIGSNNIPVAIE